MTEAERGSAQAERPLCIGAPPRRLEARLAAPAAARAGVVIAHPHPEYGGDMDNGVVVALASAFAARGWASLRFNFGGVGTSEGSFSGGAEEVRDARAAVEALAARVGAGTPVLLAGYSFGAWVALTLAADLPGLAGVIAVAPPLRFFTWECLRRVTSPMTMVVGEHDPFCPPASVAEVERAHGGRVRVRRLPGMDHFFAGREAEVAAIAAGEGASWVG
jgi:hypothetical protein